MSTVDIEDLLAERGASQLGSDPIVGQSIWSTFHESHPA